MWEQFCSNKKNPITPIILGKMERKETCSSLNPCNSYSNKTKYRMQLDSLQPSLPSQKERWGKGKLPPLSISMFLFYLWKQKSCKDLHFQTNQVILPFKDLLLMLLHLQSQPKILAFEKAETLVINSGLFADNGKVEPF